MKASFFPIIPSAQATNVRQLEIDEIKRRFHLLQQARLQRIQTFLQPNQRVFLDVLPLIFHQNLPTLPGFISSETPSDIAGFIPSGRHLEAAKKLSKSFTFSGRLTIKTAIEGLFLMGSVGSMAFSKNSDMDIWLCYRPDLTEYEISDLQKKAEAVEKWAASLQLEVHFFLMDSVKFQQGKMLPISKESSGKTQHYLLLEEFYRTAVQLAGKSPAWWFVPPYYADSHHVYIEKLLDARVLSTYEIIDFGGLNEVPAEEFISATFWHIYKSLEAPHKSVLKLLLMECYASEYPQPQWLCEQIKSAIYQGTFADVDLDPYFLIYRKVENYLHESGQNARIDLIRHCFYLKIMGLVSQNRDIQSRDVRAGYIDKVALEQNWSFETVAKLKALERWDIKKAVQEHVHILQQLSQCFRMIVRFAKAHVGKDGYQDNGDQKLIGRKLYSFLDKKPGKIEILTTRNLLSGKEQEISIVETEFDTGAQGWSLCVGKVGLDNASADEPLQKFRRLAELLCWLAGNRVYQKSQQIYFHSAALVLSVTEIHALLSGLETFFTNYLQQDMPIDTFRLAKRQAAFLLIINLGLPSIEITKDNYVISERSDVLSYGLSRQCFVQTVDKISVSNWNEITTSHYFGIEGLFTALTEIINSHTKPLAKNNVFFICHTPMRANSIVLRIEAVLTMLCKLFGSLEAVSKDRFIMAGENFYYLFHQDDGIVNFKMLATIKQVLAELGRSQDTYSNVYFDPGVLDATPIPSIYAYNKPGIIQLFYYVHKAAVKLYVLDERGSLLMCQHDKADPAYLLYQYAQFLESIIMRAMHDDLTIDYYEIIKDAEGMFSCLPIDVKTPAHTGSLVVRITGETLKTGISYTIYCNEKEFSTLDYGDDLFSQVQRYIHQFRTKKSDYPIYISDLDLPLSAFNINSYEQLQTVHYLSYKQKIEAKFNS